MGVNMLTGGMSVAHLRSPKIRYEAATTQIPVIDFGLLKQQSTVTARSAVIEDIKNACQKLGCFHVVNHGISKSVISGALEAASSFFHLPPEKKSEFESFDLKKPVRYEAALQGNNNKLRLLLKHYANPLRDWIPFWPQNPPNYRETMGAYSKEIQQVAVQLIYAILESLGLGPNYHITNLENGMQLMAVNYYPYNNTTPHKIGLHAHTDYGFITILLQTCDGLQISHNNGNTWQPVHIQPGALHVHLGDHMEVLSNGRYKGLMHRAVLGCEERISMASIHGLSMNEKVGTLKELVDEQHPKRYRESSFTDFLEFISSGNNCGGKSFIQSLRNV
ncbi:2-oxoglutarate (2OG) and Fe(II)-dependent oxygenase superfamily protein [Rhynchospora pubera]|uniref:2-oxoglutarate (2OG) and Fe(II)-dependent oxygenase superfamily protein n=1 Tax=Rhynchospora pubera TaxID=906938 RepID=A0AAV8EF05_9POAL|nr:2-oxoglutarate (2OG) and Fe(II)-dependent oxygenase superfamily protein [Rhynchospora pubera]